MKRNTRFLAAALLILPLLFSLGLNEAFAGSTQTGTIRGKIVDDKGQPLPGVTVLFRSDALIREQAAVTDADGSYFMANLPPGRYTIVAQMSGYTTLAQDTTVQIDKLTLLPNIQMREGELQETVTVTADKPIVDKTNSEKSTVIESDFAAKLPAGRSYQSLIQYAPGVTGGANPNVLGGTQNSNIYLVDGVNSRDPVTGTFGLNINYDAVEDVDIKLTGISAEYGQHQGGVINVTTKTGGNEWSGSLRDVISAPSWTNLYTSKSQKYFALENAGYVRPPVPSRSADADNKTNRINTTLGGPIVPDNAWFFLSYDRIDTSASASLGNPNGGSFGDGNFTDFFDGNFAEGKLTWQVTNDHRLQSQYSEDPARTTRCYGEVFFGGPCYESYTVDLQNQGGFLWLAGWNATWGPNVVSDVKVTRFKNTFRIAPLAPIPLRTNLPVSTASGENGPSIDLISGANFDANIFSEDPEDRLREQYEGAVTIFFDTAGAGSNTLKVGADYWRTEQVGSSIIQGNSLFFFSFVNPPAGLGGTGLPYDETNRSYLLWYDYAPPTSATPVNKYTALYVNDTWQLNDFLTFNLGLRAEKSENLNDMDEKIIDDEGIAPRLGVNWDITGQGKYVVSATAARYIAGINLTTLSPFVRAAGGQTSYDIYYNLDYPAPPAPGGQPNWVLIGQVRPDPDTATFAKDLKPQTVDEGAVAFDVALTPTFGVGVQGVYRKWNDTITSRNSYDYSTGTARKIVQFINNDDVDRDYKALILRAEKRLADHWSLMGNYTYSIAEGNVASESGFDTYGNYPGVPQATDNKFGELPWDSTHNFKLQGFFDVPIRNPRHAVTFGAIYDYRSGFPYAGNANVTSTVVGPGPDGVQDVSSGTIGPGLSDDQTDAVTTFFEQRGEHRAPHNMNLDLAAIYRFNFIRDVNFETRFEVFNVTNEQRPIAVRSTFNTDGSVPQTFGYPTAYSQMQNPRSFRVNFAVTW